MKTNIKNNANNYLEFATNAKAPVIDLVTIKNIYLKSQVQLVKVNLTDEAYKVSFNLTLPTDFNPVMLFGYYIIIKLSDGQNIRSILQIS